MAEIHTPAATLRTASYSIFAAPSGRNTYMSNGMRIDRESFQSFLADAFAVQQSGLNPQTLATFVAIQRFMASDEFDLDTAIHMIAECALGVAQAAGVAIAQLVDNELVYRAGIGTAAEDVGRHIPAVLSASSPDRPEILRVENAAANPRIEAEICRQFGAMSLIMLPIQHNHALAGVLQVLFNEAHSFDEHEVRAYRVLVGALEHGIAHLEGTYQTEPVQAPTPIADELPDVPKQPQFARTTVPGSPPPRETVVPQIPQRQPLTANLSRSFDRALHSSRDARARAAAQARAGRNQLKSAVRTSVDRLAAVDLSGPLEYAASAWRNIRTQATAQLDACKASLSRTVQVKVRPFSALQVTRSSENATTAWHNVRARAASAMSTLADWLTDAARMDISRFWYTSFRLSEAAILGLAVLMTALWVVNRNHSSTSNSLAPVATATQSPPSLPKPSAEDKEVIKPVSEPKQAPASAAGFKRVRVGPNEVDYIGDDVTIRHFETRPAKPQLRKNAKERNFGNDVTVRYFADAPQPATRSGAARR